MIMHDFQIDTGEGLYPVGLLAVQLFCDCKYVSRLWSEWMYT